MNAPLISILVAVFSLFAFPAYGQEAAPSPKVDYNQMNRGSFGGCQQVTTMLEPVCEQDPAQTRSPSPAKTKSRGRGADKRFETPKVDYNQMGRFGIYHGCQQVSMMLEPICEQDPAQTRSPSPATIKSRGRGVDKLDETPKVDYNQMGRFGVYHGCQQVTMMLEPVCEQDPAQTRSPSPAKP